MTPQGVTHIRRGGKVSPLFTIKTINQMKKESKTKWYSYKELTTSKYGIKWKVYLNKYIKGCKGWKHCKANEFEYLLDSKGNITEVRNIKILINPFKIK